MPKIAATYAQLRQLRDDILHQQQISASFFYFQMPRVERFFKVNDMQLKILQSRLDEFITKYVKHDENGQPITEQKEDGAHWVFESDENKDAYLKAIQHFLNLKTTMEV